LSIESFDVEFIEVVDIVVVLIGGDVEIATGSPAGGHAPDLAFLQLFLPHQFQ
jgi:hypothetical protein